MPPEKNSQDPGVSAPQQPQYAPPQAPYAQPQSPYGTPQSANMGVTGPDASPFQPQTIQPTQPSSNFYDPQAATPGSMPPAPGVPVYGAPQAPYGYPGAPAYNPVAPGGKSKKGLFVGLGIAGAAVVLVAAGLFAYVAATRITVQDVTDARKNIQTISDDIDDVKDAMDSLESSNDSSEFDEHAATVSTKLAHAEAEYKTLKGSPVQRNKDIADKFKEVDAKWAKYIKYAKDNVADLKTLSPILLKLTRDSEDLTAHTPTTTAALKTYLSDYKKILDDTSDKISAVKMSIDDNQKIVDSFKTFLDDSSAATARAQKDLEANNTTALYTDLGAISDAQSTLDGDIADVQADIRDYETSIDPYDDFSKMLTALSKLQYELGG